jgi:pimeloyl-ACP methyl ester carboxylesterase
VGLSVLFAAILAALLAVPLLTGLLAVAENLRSGEFARQGSLCRCPLPLALLLAFVNAAWTLWVTALLLPLGRLAPPRSSASRPPGAPPVILVHGLYHNPAAWLVLRRRLAAAGFADVRCFAYSSFGPPFADIATSLADMILATAADMGDGRVLLVGHSLGGLLIRAACADARLARAGTRMAGVVTLGTPHRGSRLAATLGMGRLARSLAPDGAAIAQVRALPDAVARGLSLYSPTDGMVLPLSGSLLDARERDGGWTQECLPPVSHVGLLYSGEAARRTIAFLKGCAAAD